MTKQEKIKEEIKKAYGEHYDRYKYDIEDGIISDHYLDKRDFENMKNINLVHIFTDKEGYCYYTPESIKGIYNNNGWIKIESEADLPKKGTNCHFILKNGFSGIFVDLDDSEYLTLRNRGTHYQPIEKPKPPIY